MRIFPVLTILFLLVTSIPAQPDDTTANLDEELFKTRLYQYQLVRATTIDTALHAAFLPLLAEYENSFSQALTANDLALARLYLDQARELLDSLSTQPDSLAPPADDTVFSVPVIQAVDSLVWKRFVSAGLEYSQYDTIGDFTPALTAGSTLHLPAFLTMTCDASGHIKYRRQKNWEYYFSGAAARSCGPLSLRLSNDFMRDDEQDSLIRDYNEDRLELTAAFPLFSRVTLSDRQTLATRWYDREDSSNYNYILAGNRPSLRCRLPLGIDLDAAGAFEQRSSRLDQRNDYHQYAALATVEKSFGWENRVRLEHESRYRDYQRPPDSARQYGNDYGEHASALDITWKLADRWSTKLGGDYNRLAYRTHGMYNPDITVAHAAPGLLWEPLENRAVGLFLHYTVTSCRTPLADSLAQQYAAGEEYHAWGVEVTGDYFLMDKLLFSAADKYEVRTYSHPDLSSVNQNTANNSLIVFLTWTITPAWSFSVNTFFDDESLESSATVGAEKYRMQNYSAELTYTF
jgi:hypothetical protein